MTLDSKRGWSRHPTRTPLYPTRRYLHISVKPSLQLGLGRPKVDFDPAQAHQSHLIDLTII
jgi:hypothetical protein